MNSSTRFSLTAALLLLMTGCGSDTGDDPLQAADRPNILLIVADDLGFSDIGPYGGGISTPSLDALSEEALRFSGFHVLPTCSPTRSALMSGNDNHVAGLGVMHEWLYPEIADLPGYAGHLADQVATIPEILRDAGYQTYMSGKWHLGEEDDQSPYARGFQRTFTMMNGGGSHWADMRPLSPPQQMIYRRNGARIESLPEDFYSTKDYTDAMIEFIEGGRAAGAPFFGYLSYTAPHDPLHAPAEYIAKYDGAFDDGWDALALRRLASLKELGLVPTQVNELPPNFMTQRWDELSAAQREDYARDMEVYAAMVDYLDMSIGRLFNYLRQSGEYDNTLIVFFSDNGANGAHASAYPGNADGAFLGTFDNRLENRGLTGSFIDMGPSWAQASSAPFRLFKSFTSQGGIRSPLIMKVPGRMDTAGRWNHAFLHVTDLLPTILELAGAEYPESLGGRTLRQPIGKSLVPILSGAQDTVHEGGGFGYELFEMKAYISYPWKILRLPEPFATGDWQLYNLAEDPGEIRDLSDDYPDIKASLIAAWEAYALENDVVDHQGRFDAAYRETFGN